MLEDCLLAAQTLLISEISPGTHTSRFCAGSCVSLLFLKSSSCWSLIQGCLASQERLKVIGSDRTRRALWVSAVLWIHEVEMEMAFAHLIALFKSFWLYNLLVVLARVWMRVWVLLLVLCIGDLKNPLTH